MVRQMTTVQGKRNFAARVQIMRMRDEGIVDAATAERLLEALDDGPMPEAPPARSLLARGVWPGLALCAGIAVALLAQGTIGPG
jgi:hypothetical protein